VYHDTPHSMVHVCFNRCLYILPHVLQHHFCLVLSPRVLATFWNTCHSFHPTNHPPAKKSSDLTNMGSWPQARTGTYPYQPPPLVSKEQSCNQYIHLPSRHLSNKQRNNETIISASSAHDPHPQRSLPPSMSAACTLPPPITNSPSTNNLQPSYLLPSHLALTTLLPP
jgi:hypothetical protein